jgi:hypothetical protein
MFVSPIAAIGIMTTNIAASYAEARAEDESAQRIKSMARERLMPRTIRTYNAHEVLSIIQSLVDKGRGDQVTASLIADNLRAMEPLLYRNTPMHEALRTAHQTFHTEGESGVLLLVSDGDATDAM